MADKKFITIKKHPGLSIFMRRLLGGIVEGDDSQKTATQFFGTPEETLNDIISYDYFFGRNTIHTTLESDKGAITDNKVDVFFTHFTDGRDRASAIIRFYDDSDTYLGKFVYKKTGTDWSKTADSTEIDFYNASNTLLISLPPADFAGTDYGNGSLRGTFDLSDSSKIDFQPSSYTLHNSLGNVDRTYSIAHSFDSAVSISMEITELSVHYSGSGSAYMRAGNEFSLWAAR